MSQCQCYASHGKITRTGSSVSLPSDGGLSTPPLIVFTPPIVVHDDRRRSPTMPLTRWSGEKGVEASFAVRRTACLRVLWEDLFPSFVSAFLGVEDLFVVQQVCRSAFRSVSLSYTWRTLAQHSLCARVEELEAVFARIIPQAAVCAVSPSLAASTEGVSPSLSGDPMRANTIATATQSSVQLMWPDSQLPTPTETERPSDGGTCTAKDHASYHVRSGRDDESHGGEVYELSCSPPPHPLTASTRSDPKVALPWRRYTLWLHAHRVANFEAHIAAHAMHCDGGVEGLAHANYQVHLRLQGGCATPGQAQRLVVWLQRRASLLLDTARIAEDRSLAALLSGEVSTAVPITAACGGGGDCAAMYDASACSPRPLAGLTVWLRCIQRGGGSGYPMTLAGCVFAYIEILMTLKYSATPLLALAAQHATTQGERLVVEALRRHAAGHITEAQADAELAVQLLPVAVRDAVSEAGKRWLAEGMHSWDAFLTVQQNLAGTLRQMEESGGCPCRIAVIVPYIVAASIAELNAASYEEILCQVAILTHSVRLRALAFVRLATAFDVAQPRVARWLLECALAFDGFCVPAAVMLAALVVRPANNPHNSFDRGDLSTAYNVLSACLHRYAMNPTGMVRRNRSDRGPSVCYIPAVLLTERSRYRPLTSVSDLAEATLHDPRMSTPYFERAIMRMREGNRAAATAELRRVMRLTLSPVDVSWGLYFATPGTMHIFEADHGRLRQENAAVDDAASQEEASFFAGLLVGLHAEWCAMDPSQVTESDARAFWERLMNCE